MRNSLKRWQAAFIVSAAVLSLAVTAKDRKDLGPKLWQAEILRADRLPADPASIIPLPWGNDPLADGSVEVRGKGQVKLDLESAAPNTTYNVLACRLSAAADRCAVLGTVETDSNGDVKALLDWPAAATGAHSVFFVLQRNGMTMYVSGFTMPAGTPPVPGTPPAAEIEVKGEVASIGSNFFTISSVTQPILVDQNTKFLGTLKSLADLQAGMMVEVSGTVTQSGILAARVQAVMGKKK